MSTLIKNLIAAGAAAVVAATVYGSTIEDLAFPAISGVQISNVVRVGDRVTFGRDFCKLRDLQLASAAFVFTYAGQSTTHTSLPISVRNETLGRSVGTISLPTGCIHIDYSAMVPRDATDGGTIAGSLWFESGHPFWDLSQSFGTVPVPAK